MRVKIGTAAQFPADTLVSVTGDNINLVVARVDGKIYAAQGQCPHLDLPLGRGDLSGCVLTCPWHGSKFDLATGKNLDWVQSAFGLKLPGWSKSLVAMGKEPAGLATYPVTEVGDEVFVEL